MATIIMPFQAFPRSDGISPGYIDVTGSPAQATGFGTWLAVASSTQDEILEMWFRIPPTLPTGTAKFVIQAVADAVTGDMDVQISWKSFATGESIENPTLSSEGTQHTFAWSTGNDWDILEDETTLDAETITADETIVVQLTLEAAGTLAADAGFNVYILFE